MNAEEKVDNVLNLENNSMCIQVDTLAEIKVLEKKSTQVEYNCENRNLELENYNDESTFKNFSDSCKMNTNENSMFQQTNAMLGTSDRQSGSNSVQDTGYQTYSMSNTTNVIDSYNSTPVKQKIYRRDRILMTDDEFHLADWKENMKNIFSSTPSRSNRKRNNHIF